MKEQTEYKDTTTAWWFLTGCIISFIISIGVGEAVASLLGVEGTPSLWKAAIILFLAVLTFSVPALFSIFLGIRAYRNGDSTGILPVLSAIALIVGYILLNVVPYLLQVLLDK